MIVRRIAVLGAVLLAGCGSNDDGGALVHGIVAGQNQSVVASGTAHLQEGVTWQLARSRNGTITARRLDQLGRFVLPQLAHAQGGTVVTGSPVPGAVVCANEDGGLKAFVPCTNTDATGKATFFFEPKEPTRAKCLVSEIRGTLNSRPAVFDTAKACVLPTDPDPTWWFAPVVTKGSTVTLSEFMASDLYGNAIPFRIVADGRIGVVNAIGTEIGARTITFTSALIEPSTGEAGSPWHETEVRDNKDVLIGHLSYRVIDQSGLAIEWHTYGLNRHH